MLQVGEDYVPDKPLVVGFGHLALSSRALRRLRS